MDGPERTRLPWPTYCRRPPMEFAPEPYRSACLATLRQAILGCRVLGWSKDAPPEQVAGLMDAVHNLPELMADWERCDVQRLRQDLMRYDRRWAGKPVWLCKAFDTALEC